MRNRTIKPQFWVDEDLARLPRDARLLYIALWNVADDGGVFEYRPERLKAQLFPYDTIPLEELCSWLDGLESLGKFIRFSNDGRSFAFLVNFPRHQRIKKPSEFRFAKPPLSTIEHQWPLSGVAVVDDSPTSETPVPLGSREWVVGSSTLGSREWVVGSRDPAAAAFQAYENNIGNLTPHIGDQLRDLMNGQHAPPEWLVEAIEIAVEHNARSLAYVKRIVERWLTEGKDNGRPDKNHTAGNRGGKRSTAEADRFAGIPVFNVDELDPE